MRCVHRVLGYVSSPGLRSTARPRASLSSPGLFHTAYLYASVIKGYTHAVIEVNPRHVAFYRRALNFQAIGPERLNKRVNAPAVLLCTPFQTIADGLASSAGKKVLPGTSRSLFYYGFPAEDEARRARSPAPARRHNQLTRHPATGRRT